MSLAGVHRLQPRGKPGPAGIDTRDGPGDAGARWGRLRRLPAAPLRPLSSQSGQGVSPGSATATHSIAAPGDPPVTASVPSEKAASTWSPARPSTRSPFHSRNADPTCSIDRRLLGPLEALVLERGGGAAVRRSTRPAGGRSPTRASPSGAVRCGPGERGAGLGGLLEERGAPRWRAESSCSVSSGSRSVDQVVPLARNLSSRSFW